MKKVLLIIIGLIVVAVVVTALRPIVEVGDKKFSVARLALSERYVVKDAGVFMPNYYVILKTPGLSPVVATITGVEYRAWMAGAEPLRPGTTEYEHIAGITTAAPQPEGPVDQP